MRTAFERSALETLSRLLGGFSPGMRMKISRFLGGFVASWIPVRRKVIEENLDRALPNLSRSERKAVIRESYANLFALGLELMAMNGASREELHSMVEVDSRSHDRLHALMDSGRGFIMVSGHIGNWEWLAAFCSVEGMDIACITKPMHNAASDSFICEMRERAGAKNFTTRQSPIRVLRHLRRGGVVGIVADQDARRNGIFVPFFGTPASTATGPAWFAYRLGMPLVPVASLRTPSGTMRLVVDEPIWPNRDLPQEEEEAEVERLTRAHVRSLEESIRAHPGQYLWFHRRWKTQPKKKSAATYE